MADDFSFACPRCGKEPKRGKFLGSEIWHDECLIEDLVEKFNNGTPREEIEKTLKRVKDQTIENKVGLNCGWPEYQPAKTQEELDAEYEAELEAAKAAEEAAEAAAAGDEAAAAEATAKAEEAQKAADELAAKTGSLATQAATQQTGSPQATTQMMPQGIPQMMPQMMQQPMQMPMMPMGKPTFLKPAPTDPTVRSIAIEAMKESLSLMKKDVAYGTLIFKILKEFNWEKLDEENDEENEEETPESIDKKEEELSEPTEKEEETPESIDKKEETPETPEEEKTKKRKKKKK